MSGILDVNLWDIDGTLTRFRPSSSRKFTEALSFYQVEFSEGDVELVGTTELGILEGFAGRPLLVSERQTLHRHIERKWALRRNPALASVGAVDAVTQLPGVHTVVTGNSYFRGMTKLLDSGLLELGIMTELGAFGESSSRRADLVEASLNNCRAYAERQGFDAISPIYVGDSPQDFFAARACRVPSYLVATGYYGVEELRQLTPGAEIVESLPELLRILHA